VVVHTDEYNDEDEDDPYNSPTLRIVVLSLFPLIQSLSKTDPALKGHLLMVLMQILRTLPAFALKHEPHDCLDAYRELVSSLTVRESASGPAEQGQAVSALLALALHQGRLSHVLSAVVTMLELDAVAETEADATPQVRSKKRKKGAGGGGDENGDTAQAIALDVEPFLQQLAEHRKATHVPSASTSSFSGSWQHNAPTLLAKAQV
jgi:hypothetical protein